MIKELTDRNLLFGTSFHGHEILTSVDELTKLFEEPYKNDFEPKVQYEWELEYENIPFSIYDWKEYRYFESDEKIWFHIGTKTKEDSVIIYNIIKEKLNGSNS